MFRRCLTTLLHRPCHRTSITMSTMGMLPDQMGGPPHTPQSPSFSPQFYRRVLPPTCIAFNSAEGKQVFREALQAGYMEAYFGLASQFRTQDEPAYCGLSTLVMVLNTLGVDPQRVWKGPWRWYHEDMLDCCVPLKVASTKGITMDEFACVAACNTLSVNMVRADGDATEEGFRDLVKSLTKATDQVLVLSYSRGVLGQTGDGHFSPLGGYHPQRDLVLVLDTARFKYPPHWVSLPLLFKAMTACDKDTGLPRGYLQLRRSDTVPLVLFRWADALSLPMLDADQVPLKSTGTMRFMQTWEAWLTQHASHVEESGVLQTAIGVLVETLGMLQEGEAVLSTQMDICCPETISSEHQCVVRELLTSLESMPTFRAVSAYLLQNQEKSEQASIAQKTLVGKAVCRMSLASVGRQLSEQAGDQDSLNTGCEIEVTLAHFVTVILLSWPALKCGHVVRNSLWKVVQAQLCCTKPVLQDEMTQLTRQLRMLMQHQERCMDCHCHKGAVQ